MPRVGGTYGDQKLPLSWKICRVLQSAANTTQGCNIKTRWANMSRPRWHHVLCALAGFTIRWCDSWGIPHFIWAVTDCITVCQFYYGVSVCITGVNNLCFLFVIAGGLVLSDDKMRIPATNTGKTLKTVFVVKTSVCQRWGPVPQRRQTIFTL